MDSQACAATGQGHNKSDILTKNLVQKVHECHHEVHEVRGGMQSITVIRGGGAYPGGGWPSFGRGLRMCLGGLIALLSGEADTPPDEDPEAKTIWLQSVTKVCFTLIFLYDSTWCTRFLTT